MGKRDYSDRPFVGVGAVIVQDGKVVLIRRRYEPLAGQWSLPGGVVEIGVYHGKFFIAMNGLITDPSVRSVAVDLFESQDLNIDSSGRGDADAFRANLTWPLRPAKARGRTFHRAGREAAGLDAEFIARLERSPHHPGPPLPSPPPSLPGRGGRRTKNPSSPSPGEGGREGSGEGDRG